MKNAMLINEHDNVLVAIEPLTAGSVAVFESDGGEERLVVREDIPLFHKLARCPIAAGAKIIKYGEHIGEAGCDIASGAHVHTHNVRSVRERLRDEENADE